MIIEIINKWIPLIFVLLMIGFIVLNDRFNKSKSKKYKNDERWQLIKAKSNHTILKYYGVVSTVFLVLYILITFSSDRFDFLTLDQFLQGGFYFVLFRYAVEYLALRHFDRVI